MIRNWETVLFIVCFIVIIVAKVCPLSDWLMMEKEKQENDLSNYVIMANSIMGKPAHEIPRNYQYPPIYPLLIIPGILSGNLFMYILSMDILFVLLIFVALVFFTRKFIDEPIATILATAVTLFDFFLLPVKSFGYPFMFGTLLFIVFLYYFIERKTWLMSSIMYMLLVGTMYVSLFLSPFILLWIFMNRKNIRDSIKTSFLFFIPAFLIFALWSLRNIIVHGMTKEGAVGGYITLNFFDNFTSRLMSTIQFVEPRNILIYSLVFIIGFVIILKRRQKHHPLYNALLFNLLFFIFIPGMSWNLTYLAWRYICFLLPCYLILGIYPLVYLIKDSLD